MFTRLGLQNFKAWRGMHALDLKPLTLVLGVNSAGKTSLLQPLLLLKQTVESPDRLEVLSLGGQQQGEALDLGTMRDILTGHDLGASLAFRLRFGPVTLGGGNDARTLESVDYEVDCASAAHEGSPFDDADHVDAEDLELVLDWLSGFDGDDESKMVLDEDLKIYEEYRRKLTDQDFGLLVVHHKMPEANYVAVGYDQDGHGVVPETLQALDRSDRKLAAAAIASSKIHERRCTIVNAVDTDWYDVEEALMALDVDLHQILDRSCRAKYEERKRRKSS